jgi:peptidoglycan/xylan/chitin deacetylase (PgdA/CDA1 family)
VSGRTLRWLASLLRVPAGEPAGPRLTILRHHRVYPAGARPLYRLGVSEPVLVSQIELLRERGVGPVTVEEGLRRLDEGRPGHVVALTFDDGYADNVHRALPALVKAGAAATFYLTAGLIEARKAPWWDVLAHALETTRRPRLSLDLGRDSFELPLEGRPALERALARLLPAMRVPPAEQASRLQRLRAALDVGEEAPCELATWAEAGALGRAGMEIGAHTLSHPFLSLLPAAEQRDEIAGSARLIAARLGVAPRGLAYPGGDHDAVTIAASREAGLDYAVVTRAGDNGPGAPRFELRRRGLYEGACLAPGGRFSRRLALAELEGAFDRLRGVRAAS